MGYIVILICVLLIFWAMEIRFKEHLRHIDALNNTLGDVKTMLDKLGDRMGKIEGDMVNIYLGMKK